MARLGIYDPAGHTLIVGTRKITGFAEGTFISVNRNNPKELTSKVGAAGEYSVVKNKDKSGTINFVLDPESASNEYLDALVSAESIVPIYIQRDGETMRDVVTAPEGWIEERPQIEADDAGPNRTWVLGAGSIQQLSKTV